ncbi:LamG-like jellyroll fold domain-containing protein [Cellulomonas soli]
MRADFQVLDLTAGRLVWHPSWTTAQASGSNHAVAVPEGLLVDGHVYRWRVRGVDASGRVGPRASCEFVVDVTAPPLPVVVPVDGGPAVYLEDQVAGGVGVAGVFGLSSGGSADVVGYLYGFDTGSPVTRVEGADVRLDYTPASSGPHTLSVQAVDRAGNVSPVRLYRFTVGSAPAGHGVGGDWLLDDGSGLRAIGSGPGGAANALTLSPTTAWVPGILAEYGVDSTDLGLRFASVGDGASTAGPVIATDGSYTVRALVRTDGDPVGSADAVSHDGSAGSAFELGYVPCADGAGACWSFSVPVTDAPAADRAVAASTAPATAGTWVLLVGVHDAAAGTARLAVCAVDTGEAETSVVPFATPWTATGPLRLGGGFGGASAGWAGVVSAVHVSAKLPSDADIRRWCSGA